VFVLPVTPHGGHEIPAVSFDEGDHFGNLHEGILPPSGGAPPLWDGLHRRGRDDDNVGPVSDADGNGRRSHVGAQSGAICAR